MGMSTYLANELLDQIFGASAWTAPVNVYFAALCQLPTSDTVTGTQLVEPWGGGGYERKAETNNLTTFAAAASRQKTNDIDITFATASTDWPLIVGWAICDAATAGNVLWWGELGTPQEILNTEVLQFDAGDLVLELAIGTEGPSDFLALELLDQAFGASAWTAPVTLYLATCSRAVESSDTGSTIIEPSGGAYARKAVTNNMTNFNAAANRRKSGAVKVTFDTPTDDWGIAAELAVLDASSAGNLLWYGEHLSVYVQSAVPISFAAGDFEALFS